MTLREAREVLWIKEHVTFKPYVHAEMYDAAGRPTERLLKLARRLADSDACYTKVPPGRYPRPRLACMTGDKEAWKQIPAVVNPYVKE